MAITGGVHVKHGVWTLNKETKLAKRGSKDLREDGFESKGENHGIPARRGDYPH